VPAAAPPTGIPVAVGDTVVSPDDVARVNAPPSQPPIASLGDLRDRIQQGDISTLKTLAPGPDAGLIERGARYGAMVGVHGLASLAQWPINALMGLGQGTGGLTIDPATNTLNQTPEGLAALQLFAPGAGVAGGRDVQFSGADAFKREAPSFLERQGDMRPMPVTLNELNAAINRVPPEQYGPPAPSTNQMAPRVGPDGSLIAPGEPAPAGAAPTPATAAAMTPQEVAINRSQAENTKLLEQQQPGVQDLNLYVDGSHPTVAQIEQTVNASREDKTLRNLNTEVSQEAREVADRNNTARQIHYGDNAGSQFDVNAATKARDDQLEADIGAAFRRKGQADAQPIVDVGQSILNGPDGKIDPVVRVVKNVTDKLYDADGNLETDPAKLWGVRKQINFLLSKEAAIETPSNQAAARQLMQLRNAVDAAIEPAAPGFGDAISNYAAASRPIDAMELLQAREPKLYDSLNRMQYSKVQQMMREAVAARHPDAPLNPWQSLSDDQMQRLWALRDDLRRSASAEDLARASGSDTVPNAIDVAKQYSGVALSAVPVLGPMAYRAKAALAPILDAAAARRQRARGMQMQYPDPAKYQLRNPLAPP
jgi:hypothetical protein